MRIEPIHIHTLPGLQVYEPTWHAMQAYTAERNHDSADEIWLLQHPPVYTLGRNGKEEHILDPGQIPVVHIDRGGQITYHGPGQLVVYLLVDIKRRKMGVRDMVSAMESAIIGLLADYGIEAAARSDAPGVYVAGAKIAALGLRIKQGRSYHGLSLNLDMDLTPFSHINPCGYEGMAVSQLVDLSKQWQWPQLEQQLSQHLCRQLGNADYIQIDTLPGALSNE
ncbi:MAG: lipoyl(octanoyl) transferase LipB [Gammaproteobacteria bacterium]|nr:lipoyl(octanoyl) transferase LipB [Gammaproteobacteria bacterium]